MSANKYYSQIFKKYSTNHIAALLLALIEQENFGKLYQNLTVKTANQLAEELSVLGFNVAKLKSNKYTYTHQLFILMSQSDTNDFYQTAENYNITLNKNINAYLLMMV